jgi:hypothetical protein
MEDHLRAILQTSHMPRFMATDSFSLVASLVKPSPFHIHANTSARTVESRLTCFDTSQFSLTSPASGVVPSAAGGSHGSGSSSSSDVASGMISSYGGRRGSRGAAGRGLMGSTTNPLNRIAGGTTIPTGSKAAAALFAAAADPTIPHRLPVSHPSMYTSLGGPSPPTFNNNTKDKNDDNDNEIPMNAPGSIAITATAAHARFRPAVVFGMSPSTITRLIQPISPGPVGVGSRAPNSGSTEIGSDNNTGTSATTATNGATSNASGSDGGGSGEEALLLHPTTTGHTISPLPLSSGALPDHMIPLSPDGNPFKPLLRHHYYHSHQQ